MIEDSDVGKAAATASGAVLCSVNDPADVNYYRVMRTIRDADRVNVVIPAAGQGKRFAEVGYQHPKPLIDVEGRPMIELVLENFRGVGRPIVLLQDRHVEQYCADSLIKSLAPDGEVVGVDGLTEGAACTVLLAEHADRQRATSSCSRTPTRSSTSRSRRSSRRCATATPTAAS